MSGILPTDDVLSLNSLVRECARQAFSAEEPLRRFKRFVSPAWLERNENPRIIVGFTSVLAVL